MTGQRIEFLKTVSFLAVLDEASFNRLVRDIQELTFDRGQVIFLENDPCRGLYIVRDGQVRVYKTSAEGREQVMFIARPGDSFNDVPVFDGGPNPATATALERTIIYLIPTEAITAIVAACPAAVAILRLLARRLRHLTSMVEDLSFRTVVSRLAKLLLGLAVAEEGPAPVRQLTQDEMAARIGTVRDVIGRGLRQLERLGAIEVARNRILVTDAAKLREVAG